MNIAKITGNTINFAEGVINKASKIGTKAKIPTEGSEKLTNSLKCLASNAISTVKLSKKPDVPEFIYHITSKENFGKILKDKKMTLSTFEAGQNGCHGVYL